MIGVYLPCLDLGMDFYCECLIELERFISESSLQGPVLVAGDFNAHLGEQGGQRGSRDQNIQGVMLMELMSRCGLSTVTMGCIAHRVRITRMNLVMSRQLLIIFWLI